MEGEKEDTFINIPTSDEIREILRETKKIAIVNTSPKEARDSNMVARYMLKQGYEIVPVNPGQKEIKWGRIAFSSGVDIRIFKNGVHAQVTGENNIHVECFGHVYTSLYWVSGR